MVNSLLTLLPQHRTNRAESGFTLVELAIALVIIGIITGGILVGSDMIRAAEIKKMIENKNTYTTAVEQFRDRFDGLPGDFRRAAELWGAAGSCASAAVDKETCSGNGDGIIGPAGQESERFRAWQHLANAELISGRFNGISDLPDSPGAGSDWGILWMGNYDRSVSGSNTFFNGLYGHMLVIDPNPGTLGASSGAMPTMGFKPDEMRSIDGKLDDGKPGTGNVVTRLGRCAVVGGSNATATQAQTAVYSSFTDIPVCSFIVRNLLSR